MQPQPTEVLVVGAGPVGMLTALLLQRNGIKTRIIDQESRTAGHSYACALHPSTLKLLDEFGLADEAIRLGHRISSVAFYGSGVRKTELKLAQLETKFPFVLVLDQCRLEDMLEEELNLHAGIGVEWLHRLTDLAMDDHGVTASVEKLGMTAKGYIVPEFELGVEKQFQIRADFVVGADGHNSQVRRLLGLKYDYAGERELYAVYELESQSPVGHEMRIALERGTASVMWPLSEHKCRWSIQLFPAAPPADFPKKDRSRMYFEDRPGDNSLQHELQHLLRERAPWFEGPIQQVGWSTEIQFEHRLASEFGKGRCWLAGDAAHQTGPVGMQSMNAGMREAADLVGTLKNILRDHGPLDSLEAYQARHRAEWNRLLGLHGGAEATSHASAWAKGNCARIPACLPVSGPDLAALLDQVGLAFASAPVAGEVILKGL